MTYFVFTITFPTLSFQEVISFPQIKKKETAFFNTTKSTDQTECVFEWKLWFTCLIAEVALWNNPGRDVFFFFFFKCVFHRLFSLCWKYFPPSCLHASLFSILAAVAATGTGFRKVYAAFHGHWLVFFHQKKKKKIFQRDSPVTDCPGSAAFLGISTWLLPIQVLVKLESSGSASD